MIKKISSMEKLKKLSITELYTVLQFLQEQVNNDRLDDVERGIYGARILMVEEEIKGIINNLF